jgi:hypothetical protein
MEVPHDHENGAAVVDLDLAEVSLVLRTLTVERVTMILTGAKDIRTLEYPHLQQFELTDDELAKSVQLEEIPQTDLGRRVAEVAHKAALELATRLKTRDNKTARWIGSDAARELESDPVIVRFRKKR